MLYIIPAIKKILLSPMYLKSRFIVADVFLGFAIGFVFGPIFAISTFHLIPFCYFAEIRKLHDKFLKFLTTADDFHWQGFFLHP